MPARNWGGVSQALSHRLARGGGMLNVRIWPRAKGVRIVGCAVAVVCSVIAGCGGTAAGPSQPDAKAKLEKLFRLYKAFVERNRRAPADEQALRDFGQKLTSEERAAYLIGDDIEGLFMSP